MRKHLNGEGSALYIKQAADGAAMAEEDMSAMRGAKAQLRQSIQVSLRNLQPADVSSQSLCCALTSRGNGLLMNFSNESARAPFLHA